MRERIHTGPVPPSWRKARTPGWPSSAGSFGSAPSADSANVRPLAGPGRSRAPGTGRGPGRACRSRDRGWPTRRAPGRSRRISLADQPSATATDAASETARSRSSAAAARPSSMHAGRLRPRRPPGPRPQPAHQQRGAGVQARRCRGEVHARRPAPGGPGRRSSAGSPPRRSSGGARDSPKSAGSTVVRVTSPSRSSRAVEGPVVVSSSRPSCPWTSRTWVGAVGLEHGQHPLGHRRVGDPQEHPSHPAPGWPADRGC